MTLVVRHLLYVFVLHLFSKRWGLSDRAGCCDVLFSFVYLTTPMMMVMMMDRDVGDLHADVGDLPRVGSNRSMDLADSFDRACVVRFSMAFNI
jgi:hypothetical protein